MTFKNYFCTLPLCPHPHHPQALLNMAHVFMATVVSDLDFNNVDNSISTLAPDKAAETTPIGFEDYMPQSKVGLADYTKGLSS